MSRQDIMALWDKTPEELTEQFKEYYEYNMWEIPETVQAFCHRMGNLKEYTRYKDFMANKEKYYKEKDKIILAVKEHLVRYNRKLNQKNENYATLDEYKNYYELFVVGGKKWYY